VEYKTYPEFSTHYPLLLTTFMKRPARLYPDQIGVVYRNPATGAYSRFTWSQWQRRVCQLAHALEKRLGVKPASPAGPATASAPWRSTRTAIWSCITRFLHRSDAAPDQCPALQ